MDEVFIRGPHVHNFDLKMLTHPASNVPRSWSFPPTVPLSLPWGNWLCNVCPEQVSSVTLSPILAYGCRQDSPLLSAGPYRSCLCSCSRGPVAGGRGGHHSTRRVPPSPSSSHRLPPQLHCPLGRTLLDVFALHSDLMCNNVTSLHPELFMCRERGEGNREMRKLATNLGLKMYCSLSCLSPGCTLTLQSVAVAETIPFFVYVTCNEALPCGIITWSVCPSRYWMNTDGRQTDRGNECRKKSSLIVIYRLSALDGGLHIDVAVRQWRLIWLFFLLQLSQRI